MTDGFYAGTDQSPQVIVIVIINDCKMLTIHMIILVITTIIVQRHTKVHSYSLIFLSLLLIY